jgi:hypothetical protein
VAHSNSFGGVQTHPHDGEELALARRRRENRNATRLALTNALGGTSTAYFSGVSVKFVFAQLTAVKIRRQRSYRPTTVENASVAARENRQDASQN